MDAPEGPSAGKLFGPPRARPDRGQGWPSSDERQSVAWEQALPDARWRTGIWRTQGGPHTMATTSMAGTPLRRSPLAGGSGSSHET